jgi:hypothetical protein
MYLTNNAITILFFVIRKANTVQETKSIPANAAIFDKKP